MNNQELPKIIDLVVASWGLQVAGARRVEMEKAWWRYLKDIPYDVALHALDILVVRDGPPPRPGAVRRLAMEQNPLISLPPEPAEAWAQAQTLVQAIEAGLTPEQRDQVHSLVREVIKIGVREYRPFVETYQVKLQEWRDQMFGIK